MDETGLVLKLRTRLARLTKDGRLAVEDDRERILALLSVAARLPVSAEVLGPIDAAAPDLGKFGYNPDQPRVPAATGGTAGGGRPCCPASLIRCMTRPSPNN